MINQINKLKSRISEGEALTLAIKILLAYALVSTLIIL